MLLARVLLPNVLCTARVSRAAKGLVAFYEGLMTCLAIGAERSEVKKSFVEFIKAIEEGILRNASWI